MRRLRELENALLRAESAVAVVLVLVMLMLAAYNVVYRNVLMPLQQRWAHSGPPIESPPLETAPSSTPTPAQPAPADGAGDFGGLGGGLGDGEASDEVSPAEGADDFGGFGGGLGDDEAPKDEAPKDEASKDEAPKGEAPKDAAPKDEAPKDAAPKGEAPVDGAAAGGDDFGGFGGGFGDDEAPEGEAPEARAEAAAEAVAGGDDFGGFGGGLGAGEATPAGDGAEGTGPSLDEQDDFGEDDLGDDDQFANLPDIDAIGQQTPLSEGPVGGPPPEGSFAAWAVQFIDDIKLDWIDIFLRQLVIIVSFLGATLATARRKHINIDALSKVLPASVQRVVSVLIPLFALGICLVLAHAGWELVQISREFPKELLPFAEEWQLQLMFPVGFGLLAVHFAVRVVEAIAGPPPPEEEARPSTVVTLVDEVYEPEDNAAGSVSKQVAAVVEISEASGELSSSKDDEGGPS